MSASGNRFTDEQVMAWFKIGSTIPDLEKTRAAKPKPAGGFIKQKAPSVHPGRPLRRTMDYDNFDEDEMASSEIRGINISPYKQQPRMNFQNHVIVAERLNEDLPKIHSKKFTYEATVSSDDVYSRYSFDHVYNKDLPITQMKDTILDTINYSPVTIIQGETGSGKTTQVPQYILDQHAKENKHCNIICTQPRRIATTSVAKYICRERNWQLGNLVGYQIQLDRKTSEDTRLTFCTTGVLLQRLVNQKNMNEYTHVILDEVSMASMYVVFDKTQFPGSWAR